jgi:hypothetical protein
MLVSAGMANKRSYIKIFVSTWSDQPYTLLMVGGIHTLTVTAPRSWWPCVGTFWSQQARRGAPCGTSTPYRSDRCESLVRPVSPGWSGERPTNVVRAWSRWGGARRVVLGSAGQLGRLQTSRRWRKNSMVGVEKVRERGRKGKYDKK